MTSLSAKHFWQKKQVDHRKGAATPGHLRILILNTPIRYSPLFTVLFLLLSFTPIVSDIPHFRYMWSRLWNPVKPRSERFHIISGFYSCITDNPQSGIAADVIRKNRWFLTYFGCTLISQNSFVFFLKRMRTEIWKTTRNIYAPPPRIAPMIWVDSFRRKVFPVVQVS